MTSICVLPGSAGKALASGISELLGIPVTESVVGRYPDGELRPRVEQVRGRDVFVVQSTSPPVGERLMELLLLLDACRRAGAGRVTAVVPYFGYARQDRLELPGQSVGIKVAADAIAHAAADGLVVVDPHTPALAAVCPVPVEVVSAVPLLAERIAPAWTEAVVVAPDLAAAALAERYAETMRESVALVRKFRVDEHRVSAREMLGEIAGHRVVVVDDMICSGGTIEATVALLHNTLPTSRWRPHTARWPPAQAIACDGSACGASLSPTRSSLARREARSKYVRSRRSWRKRSRRCTAVSRSTTRVSLGESGRRGRMSGQADVHDRKAKRWESTPRVSRNSLSTNAGRYSAPSR